MKKPGGKKGSEPEPEIQGGSKAAMARLRSVKLVGSHNTGLEDDPELQTALGDDAQTVAELDSDIDVEETMEQALEEVGDQRSVREYPIGNGTTLPFPSDGEYTTEVATCDPHIPNVSRGCGFHSVNGKPKCPFGTGHPLGKKYGWKGGSANLIYKNLRTGQVKTCFCVAAMSAYLFQPHIVFLAGPEWYPTRRAEYEPLPNGQQPMPGPGQPRTRINLIPNKTQLLHVPPKELVEEFQKMRRRGDFIPREPRRRRR